MKLRLGLLVGLSLLSAGCQETMQKAVTGMNLIPVVPAQSDISVLTVLAIDRDGFGRLSRWEIICSPDLIDKNLLKSPAIQNHRTQDISNIESKSASGNLVVSPETVKQINAKLQLSGHSISSIKYKISNAHLTNAVGSFVNDYWKNILNAKQGDSAGLTSCLDVIKERQSRGKDIKVIETTFVADTSYEVTDDTGAQVAVTADIAKVLNAELNATIGTTSNNTAVGQGLTHGMNWPL